jgi:hypothetical protein
MVVEGVNVIERDGERLPPGAKAPSPAPGLQKHPVRTEMRWALASRVTMRSSTTSPAGPRTLNATVPPRSAVPDRDVPDRRAAGPGELADPVSRVVVGGRQHQPRARAERVRLSDKPAGAGRVRGEDDRVLVGGGVEVGRIAARVRSTSSVEALDVGLSECGLPKHAPRRRLAWARSCASAGRPEPV